jgi:hypothetical protein
LGVEQQPLGAEEANLAEGGVFRLSKKQILFFHGMLVAINPL